MINTCEIINTNNLIYPKINLNSQYYSPTVRSLTSYIPKHFTKESPFQVTELGHFLIIN